MEGADQAKKYIAKYLLLQNSFLLNRINQWDDRLPPNYLSNLIKVKKCPKSCKNYKKNVHRSQYLKCFYLKRVLIKREFLVPTSLIPLSCMSIILAHHYVLSTSFRTFGHSLIFITNLLNLKFWGIKNGHIISFYGVKECNAI